VDFGQRDDLVESVAHGLEVLGVAGVVAEQVDRHDAVLAEAVTAGFVKLRRVEHGAARGGVVQVDLQRIDGAVALVVVDEVIGVHFQQRQATVFRRQLEHAVADRDHRWVQFDRRDVRLGKLAIAELGQRRRAQAQLHDVLRRLVEQHPAHHLLRVFELDPVGLADAHGALHPFGAEVQVAHAVLLRQRDRGKARLARRGDFGLGFDLVLVWTRAGFGVGLRLDGFAFDQHDVARIRIAE